MSDKFIRKQVVFNSESAWHMKILTKLNKESISFSSLVMSILKEHLGNLDEVSNEEIEHTRNKFVKAKKEPNKQPRTAAYKAENNIPLPSPKVFKK